MLRLRTFGGIALESDAGPLGGAAAQRRRLAVLATLAVAGPRGMSRDKLLGLLWPETDSAKGRAALSQALYALRRDAGAEELVVGGEDIRLNTDVLTSDLADFEAAIAAGERERAATLYAGPFLDGVYLDDAGEFERWADEHRARLARMAERALEDLASEADARGDYEASATWWRRLTTIDPLKTCAALGLANALAATGDRAGAIRHAATYAKLVRTELDAEPNPRVTALVDKLRGESAPEHFAGRYAIEREIGRGGMAVVFLARDVRHDRPVALKMLHPELGAAIGGARFEREILVTARLQHPHILPLHDSGEADGTLYYVMPYVDGESLRAKMQREEKLPVADAVRIAREIADALDHAHRRGVVHRDIKPENVLIAEGHAVVADFGIARTLAAAAEESGKTQEQLTQSGLALGTPAYMSPEQIVGDPEVDARSDIYSLGCVLYEMLAGRPPWIGTNARKVLAQRFTESPPHLREVRDGVPRQLEDVVSRALDPEPARRYQSSGELARALETLGSGKPSPLPAPPGPIVGRESELASARALILRPDVRHVTLTGTGGTGKTRLALALASAVEEHFADGAWFVDLTPLTDAGLVMSAIAHVIGVAQQGDQPVLDAVATHLGARHTLLVLDNFEQVIGAAPVLSKLIAACPRLSVLVTSRARLRIRGEHEFFVAPLAVPDLSSGAHTGDIQRVAAVDLFIQRAMEARPELQLDDAAIDAVAKICVRLDGLPLAIELAAARSKLLSPQAILSRLDHRFELLTGGARDVPERHQTLRAALAWSHDLLDDEQRIVFRRLAAFIGGSGLDAVAAVTGRDETAALEVAQSLAEESLVRRADDARGEPRVAMLETIRAYALDKLSESGEDAVIRDAHRDFYFALAERMSADLTGANEVRALRTLDVERDNIRAALDWSAQHSEPESLARASLALWRYWLVRGQFSEGRDRLRRAIERGTSLPDATRAELLAAAGTLAQNQGDYASAFDLLQQTLAIWRAMGDTAGEARALASMGWLDWRRCEFAEGRELSRESLELHRTLGDERGVAQALNNLGWIALFEGDYDGAARTLTECLAIRRRLGHQRNTAFVLTSLGWATLRRGDLAGTEKLIDEALALFRGIGERQLQAFALRVSAELALVRGDAVEAVRVLESESLPVFREIGDRWGMMYALGVLGDALQATGRSVDAVRAYEESRAIAEALGDRYGLASSDARFVVLAAAAEDFERAAGLAERTDSLLREIGGALPPAQRATYERARTTARAAVERVAVR